MIITAKWSSRHWLVVCDPKVIFSTRQRRKWAFPSAASIWFEIWVVVDPGQQNFDFSMQISEKFWFFSRQFHKKFRFFRKISEKFRFLRQIFKKNRFFQANFWKISNFSGKFWKNFKFFRQFKKNPIFQAKLLISSYFWVNYSISLQKSPLSNIFSVHDTIYMYHDPSMVHDPLRSRPAQNLGVATPQSTPGLTLLFPSQLLIPILCWMRKAIIVTFGSDGKSNPPSLLSNLPMWLETAGVCAKNFITLGFWTFLRSGRVFSFASELGSCRPID